MPTVEDYADLSVLKTRIFTDYEQFSSRVDFVYLFGQTSDNQESVLRAGAELYHGLMVSRIGILDGQTNDGYPGYQKWHNILRRAKGVDTNAIFPVVVKSSKLNTLSESEALVDLIKRRGCKYVAICATPFHLPRCFMTLVTVLLDEKCEDVRVYNYCGDVLDWYEKVYHSQGIQYATRHELIREEDKKIFRYQREGDRLLISPGRALLYILKRDGMIT